MAHISEAAPLQISRFYTGLYTFRNPLIVPVRMMGRRIIELYDAIADGLNMECTNRLTLARRPGYTLITPTLFNGKVLYFTSFKPSNFPGQIYPIIDSTTAVAWFDANQPSHPYTVLLNKMTPALTNFAAVGAYEYIAQELVAQKWDSPGGVQGVTNWGIDMYSSLATQGPLTPSTVTNMTSTQPVPFPWTLSGQGGSVTLAPSATAPTGTTVSGWLLATGFGFPSYTDVKQYAVAGMTVELQGVSAQGSDIGFHVRLVRNNALYGTYRNVTLPPNITTIDIGRPNDAWDGAWSLNDILQPGFGVAIQAVNTSSSPATYSLTGIRMVVTYNQAPLVGPPAPPPGPGPHPPPTGGLVAEVGYRYQYAYGNSHSGHISSPSLPSWFEGGLGQHGTLDGLIVPSNFPVTVFIPAPADPQITDIHIFRTTDGGGLPFFELPNSPIPANTTVAPSGFIEFFDGNPDNTLQIANICPDPHFNDPPPGGMLDPVWYAGRLWGHRGNQLFFSSGPDVSMGNGEEAWYPVYVFAIPSGQIVRKFPTPNGLLLAINDELLIARGIATPTFTVNDFAKDIGMRTWTAADSDGTNVYLLTSDRQFLLLNANGFTAVSADIADKIQQVDPSKAYVAQYRYTAMENLVFVGDGSKILFPYNQELTAWNTPQQPIQGVTAIGTLETSPGVYQFWRARPSGTNSLISFRDVTSFLDEDTPYPCSVTFGPIPVADFLTLAQLRDIVVSTATTDTRIRLSVLANEIFPMAGSQFQILQISSSEPPELSATPSLSYTANRYTWKSAPLPELINLYFKRIDFSAEPNPDELFAWTAGGTQTTGGSSLGAPGQLPQIQGR